MPPEPMTPADCDLQDFPFMPLHVARLRDSDLASEEEPEACWYAVLLWAASWHQIPAASLPDNDAVLTKLIGLGRDVKTFLKHKAGATRGFVKCSDGRLYHPIVAEQALSAWDSKLQQRWRTECARIKKHNQRNDLSAPTPTLEEFMSSENADPSPQIVPRDVPEKGAGQLLQGTETGTETGTIKKEADPDGSGAKPPSVDPIDPLADIRGLPIAKGSWRLALKLLMDRGGYPESRARPLVGKWAKALNGDHDLLWAVSEQAWSTGTLDPVSYVTAAIERGDIAAKADPLLNPSETRQRLWMQDFKAMPSQWREHERGPPPGKPGCRVSPEIQREFTPAFEREARVA